MKSLDKRHKVIPAVYAVFKNQDKVLLLKRANTGYYDDYYSLPAGHVGGIDEKGGEPALKAMAREIKEEVDADVDFKDLQLVHTMHRFSSQPEPHERIDLFFEIKKWGGKLKNAEPNKCAEIRWAKLSNLPDNLIPEVKQALLKVEAGDTYSEFNF